MKNLLPPETLVDVVDKQGIEPTKQMTLSEYYILKKSGFRYQAFQVGFLA